MAKENKKITHEKTWDKTLFAEEEKKKKKTDKKVLSFFLLMFPTIIIVAIGMLSASAWWVMVALAFYQAIMLKQFLDTYYDSDSYEQEFEF